MKKTNNSKPVGYTHSQFLISIDVDKACDDSPYSDCMKGRCMTCSWDAAYICPTKAIKYHKFLTSRQFVERDLPEQPTPPPVRKISNGKPITEGTFKNSKGIPFTTEYVGGKDTYASSVKEWLLPENYSTPLIFFIGGCIIGSMFTTLFN